MKIRGSQLSNIISESIIKIVTEEAIKAKVKNRVKAIIKESFENQSDFTQFEKEEKKTKSPMSSSDDERLADIHSETEAEKTKRNQVEAFFKKPGVDNAPYAYELYGVIPREGEDTNDMKNARKKFSDNVNHAKNSNGYAYTFTSGEINRLQSLISNSQLSEAIDNAFRKVFEK